MKRYNIIFMTLAICLLHASEAGAQSSAEKKSPPQTLQDSVLIHFRQSKWNLDRRIGDNEAVLDSIDRRLTTMFGDSMCRLRHVSIYGGASPEGPVKFNKFLSEERAATLFRWFDKYNQLSDLDKTYTFYGRDWEGVLRLAEADASLPHREETLNLLRTIAEEKRAAGGEEPPRSLERLKRLLGGVPYRYLYRNIFPTVRASKVVIDYERILAPEIAAWRMETPGFAPGTVPTLCDVEIPPAITVPRVVEHWRPFYMDVRTNMLYDILAVPNIGVEFYLGKNWTIGGNYMHSWWSYDRRHRYWRLYGGELNVRRWFGKAAMEKPLTGHHLGLYAQAVTWDFEWGGKGYMGGMPHGSIFDLAHLGIGAEYGYSLPVAERLNIDFSLGIGYIGGKIHEYIPNGDRYLWTATKKKKWFGPTKLEVALVWLIGKGNCNKKKGGDR